jgi:hypothetical protein
MAVDALRYESLAFAIVCSRSAADKKVSAVTPTE